MGSSHKNLENMNLSFKYKIYFERLQKVSEKNMVKKLVLLLN